MRKRFVIVGGGISGLTTAYYILQKARSLSCNVELFLLEQDARLGGNVRSIQEEGFTFDFGPKGFLAKGRHTLALVEDLGLFDQLLLSSSHARVRYVWEDCQLKALDLKSLLSFQLLGLKDLWVLVSEYFKRNVPMNKDESVAEFITRRFSKDILDRFVELVLSGVYAGDPLCLSAQALFPKIVAWEMEYGSILKGFLRTRSTRPAKPQIHPHISNHTLVSFRNGMETLVHGLASKLSSSVILNCCIQNIVYNARTVDVYALREGKPITLTADHLIFATPAFITAKYLRKASEQLADELSAIKYAPLHVVCCGYRGPVHSLAGFGFLSARKQNLKMLGAIWNECIFPSFAPPNTRNITAMYGGAMHPETIMWDTNQLLEQTYLDLQSVMGIGVRPEYVHVCSYKEALPQYNVGHSARRESILSLMSRTPHVHLVGNYLYGVGVNDVVEYAQHFVQDLALT